MGEKGRRRGVRLLLVMGRQLVRLGRGSIVV
jgi:hypothetical protein